MMDFEKICRACMRHNEEFFLIFDEKNSEESTGIVTMLEKCTKYKVRRVDGLPQHVCSSCLEEVKIAYNFKQKCEKSYRRLKQILRNPDSLKTGEIYPCERCDQKFDDIYELRSHRFKEHKGSDIACRFCSKTFDRVGNLRLHNVTFHPEAGYTIKSKCPICDFHFARTSDMRRHLRNVHKVDNDYGKDKIINNETEILKNAVAEENVDDADTVKQKGTEADTPNTDKDNMDKDNLKNKDHDAEEIYETNNYDMGESDIDDENEIESNTNDIREVNSDSNIEIKIEKKDIVEKIVTNAVEPMHTILINDMDILNIKSEQGDTIDDVSDEDTSNEDPVFEPKNEESDTSSSICTLKETKMKKSKSVTKEKFNCEECNKSFVNEEIYKKHRDSKHAKKFECKACHMTFTRTTDYRKHPRICEKKYTCKACAKICKTRQELDDHQKSEGHNKPVLCTVCGLRFVSQATFIVHMRRHTGERPYKCKFCNKGFPCADTVRKHERFHKDERDHVCETCGKRFQRKSHLIVHIRLHTGETPYKCTQCPKAFRQSQDLKTHIRRHTGERMSCELCDSTFLQTSELNRHMFKKHGIKKNSATQRLKKFTSVEQQEQQIKELQQQKESS